MTTANETTNWPTDAYGTPTDLAAYAAALRNIQDTPPETEPENTPAPDVDANLAAARNKLGKAKAAATRAMRSIKTSVAQRQSADAARRLAQAEFDAAEAAWYAAQ